MTGPGDRPANPSTVTRGEQMLALRKRRMAAAHPFQPIGIIARAPGRSISTMGDACPGGLSAIVESRAVGRYLKRQWKADISRFV